MQQVEQASERCRYRLFRGIAGCDDGLLEDLLNANPGERGARRKNSFFRVTDQDRSERPERHSMRPEDLEAGGQGEDKSVAPSPDRHVRSATRVVRRQFVVKRDDDGLFAREVAIQESDTDARVFGDLAQGRRFVAAGCDQFHRRRVQPIPCRGTLEGRSWRPATFPWFDIFSEHVHYY